MASAHEMAEALRQPICTLCSLGANLTARVLAYNMLANVVLYLVYELTPRSQFLQAFNREILSRLFWF